MRRYLLQQIHSLGRTQNESAESNDFHDFWTYAPDSQDFQMQMIQFMKNLGLMGAMLMIIANGPGPGSLENRKTSTTDGEN